MNSEIVRLDLLLMRIRRLAFQPDPGAQLLPGIEHPIPSSRVYACTLIGDFLDHSASGQLSIKEIAAGMNLEHSSASRLLTELEADGLIERQVDSQDRRRTNIVLTAEGRAVVSKVAEIRYWVMGQVLADVDPNDVKHMADTMEQILDLAQSRLPELIQSVEANLGVKTFSPNELL